MSWIAVGISAVVVSGGYTGYSQYQQGASQKKYYDAMADQASLEGEYQLAIAQKQSELVQDQSAQEIKQGSIKNAELNAAQVAVAANNGTAGTVTAQDIASSTFKKGKEDELAMRYNADTKSWSIMTQGGYDKFALNQQADQYRAAGKNAKKAGTTAMVGTILSTAASVAALGIKANGGKSSGVSMPIDNPGQ